MVKFDVNTPCGCSCGKDSCCCAQLVQTIFSDTKQKEFKFCKCTDSKCTSFQMQSITNFQVKFKNIPNEDTLLNQFSNFKGVEAVVFDKQDKSLLNVSTTSGLASFIPFITQLTPVSRFEAQKLFIFTVDQLPSDELVKQITERIVAMEGVSNMVFEKTQRRFFVFGKPVERDLRRIFEVFGQKVTRDVTGTSFPNPVRFSVDVLDMKCVGCVDTISNELEKQPGIDSVQLDIVTKRAFIQARPFIEIHNVIELISKFGFVAKKSIPNTKDFALFNFEVTGMKCGGCASTISKRLESIPGVLKADVDIQSKSVKVSCTEKEKSKDVLLKTIKDLGFEARLC
jgi:copper chaperone CopZ